MLNFFLWKTSLTSRFWRPIVIPSKIWGKIFDTFFNSSIKKYYHSAPSLQTLENFYVWISIYWASLFLPIHHFNYRSRVIFLTECLFFLQTFKLMANVRAWFQCSYIGHRVLSCVKRVQYSKRQNGTINDFPFL